MAAFLVMIHLVGVVVPFASAQQKHPPQDQEAVGIHITYDTAKENNAATEEMVYAPPIESLADNPVVAMGLASGTDAINRSVDSLMDSLFYSLLDNDRIIPVTDDSWFHLGIRRDVFSTSSGTYVVFDRFQAGPNYVRELARFHDIPIKLGLEASTEVMQIYLRSDGLRVHEQEKLSFWRKWANLWFGFLPFLSTILPPSFNQNEMYDPLRQLGTPFSFPFGVRGFYEMPIGSIRSYAISGGARIFADLGLRYPQDAGDFLGKIGGFQATMPYSLFVRGEHRINVLRRGENLAWVGIKNLKRTGHALNSLIGQRYNLFKGALSAKIFSWNWIWQGRPVMILPLDLNIEQAKGVFFDQVYQFDLTKIAAKEAYEAAVRGDFLPSRIKYLEAKERGLDTGVGFHFARNQKRNEILLGNGPNIAVYRNQRSSVLAQADIEITDADGKFYVLEASHDLSDKSWDVLVGEKEKRTQQSVELRVRKAIKREVSQGEDAEHDRHFYIFDTGPDPYRLSVMLSIQDRNLVGSDLTAYIERLRQVSGLPMTELPTIKIRDPLAESRFRRARFFSGPDRVPSTLHVTPAFLGRFGAQLLVSFSSQDLDRILDHTEDEMWSACADAYGIDGSQWGNARGRSTSFQKFWHVASFIISPLRLANIRFPWVDSARESSHLVAALLHLKKNRSPGDMLEGFEKLLDTSYPEQLIKALLVLGDISKVARRIVLSTEAKGRVSEAEKRAFGNMNNMVFVGGAALPGTSRYHRSKEKLAGFYLDKPIGSQDRPRILRIDVVSNEVPTSLQFVHAEKLGLDWMPHDALAQSRHVLMSVAVKGGPTARPIKMFIKIEQAGRLKLGKLELAEKVLELPPVGVSGERKDLTTYETYLTGPLSPLQSYWLDRSMQDGDQFQVTVSVSIDGIEWGDARTLAFRFQKGRLMPPH